MTKAEKNLICEEVRKHKIKECWTCSCGKHHICKEGAELCCTNKVSNKCDCRHCNARRKQK